MTQNIVELWEQQSDATLSEQWATGSKTRTRSSLRERLKTLKHAAERRIDDWIGSLDDSQSRPNRGL